MSEAREEKLPLKLKLKAWWEGYDQAELAAAYLARRGAPADEEVGEDEPKEVVLEGPPPPSDFNADAPVDLWDDQRVDVAQYIWGEGYCGPGGTEHIISISKLLALSPEMSMADIGARLGGPARALADEFGVWVTGYEESETLVNAANELSERAGLLKKAEVHHYTPDSIDKLDRKFDRALAKDSLFRVTQKKNLLHAIYQSMKNEGLFLITDYTLGPAADANGPALEAWKELERGVAHPVPSGELKSMVEEVGFSARVFENVSEQYQGVIAKAWAGAEDVVAKLSQKKGSASLIDTLLKEAEYWARRSDLLKSGALEVWRILAYKKES